MKFLVNGEKIAPAKYVSGGANFPQNSFIFLISSFDFFITTSSFVHWTRDAQWLWGRTWNIVILDVKNSFIYIYIYMSKLMGFVCGLARHSEYFYLLQRIEHLWWTKYTVYWQTYKVCKKLWFLALKIKKHLCNWIKNTLKSIKIQFLKVEIVLIKKRKKVLPTEYWKTKRDTDIT